jgi:hypothetical protein
MNNNEPDIYDAVAELREQYQAKEISEQGRRFGEVKSNRRIWYNNLGQVTKDVDFLIALAGRLQSRLLEVERERDNAATSMRSACVAKVKAMRTERLKDLHAFENSDNHKDEADYERAVVFVLSNVITALESVSIQEQEK